MIVCPKCGKELADGTKFCSKCGTPLADVKPKAEEPKAEAPKAEAPKAEAPKAEAPKAEAPKAEEAKAEAPKAEAPKAEEAKAEAPKAEAPKAEAPKAEEPKAEGEEKKPNTWIKYVCIGAAVVVFLFLVISLFSGKKGGKPYALYLKDKEIMYTNLKAKGAWQLTAKLSKDGDMDTESLTDRIDLFTECELSPDGKIMFFPDKLERNDGTTLYYRYINKPKKEPIKMDSSVRTYYINKAATLVTYIKTTGDLYQYNIKKEEKSKIASEVSVFKVSEDGGRVVYLKKSGELYTWNKKDSEKMDSEVDDLEAVYDKNVYYVKDDTLYKKVGSKDKEKIASDIYYVANVYKNGQAYYVKKDDSRVLYFFNGKEAEKVAEDLDDVISFAMETPAIAYSVKDSESSSKKTYAIAVKTAITELEQTDATKIRFQKDGKAFYYLADLNKDGDEGDMYRGTLSSSKVGKIEKYDSEVNSYTLAAGITPIYFKDYKKGVGDMYFNKKKVDSDVYGAALRFCEKTKQIYYLVDFSKDAGTLKVSKNGGKPKKIADDVYGNFAVLSNGYALYLYDYSTKYYRGELYLYKGGKPVKLDDEVSAILLAY